MKWKVLWNYRSSLGGPWLKGDVIELDQATAEAVNRDSPGVLKSVAEKRSSNRMVTEAQQRTFVPDDREGGANDQGPITKADFKAVRDK